MPGKGRQHVLKVGIIWNKATIPHGGRKLDILCCLLV